jgi:hypothetical protein
MCKRKRPFTPKYAILPFRAESVFFHFSGCILLHNTGTSTVSMKIKKGLKRKNRSYSNKNKTGGTKPVNQSAKTFRKKGIRIEETFHPTKNTLTLQ